MQDGLVEPGTSGELGVGVQRVPVAGEAVEQGLVRAHGAFDGPVGFAGGRIEAVGRAAVAAPAALAAYEDLGVVGPQRAVGVGDLGAQDQDGGLALVVDGGEPTGRGRRALGRDGAVDLHRLPAVQDLGEFDLHTGHGQPADHARRAGARDGGEARQDLQPGLQGVAQLVGIGGGAFLVRVGSGADAEVVELDVLGAPGDLAGPGLGGESLGCVDGHGAPDGSQDLGADVRTVGRTEVVHGADLERVPVRRPLYSPALHSCEGS